jgi:hypothetical protein
MNPDTTPIETSPQSNLEVIPPVTSTANDSDWGTRMGDLLDKATSGEDPYAPSEEVKTEKKTKTAKTAKAKPEPVKSEETPEPEESEEEKSEGEAKEEEEPKAEEAPANLTDKAKVKWGELRAEAAQAKKLAQEVETLKAELEKAKAAPVDSAEVEKLRQINAEYEQELSVARVEATQEYKSNVVEPMVNVVGYLNSLAEKYELNSKEMLSAFAEGDLNKQSDLIADLAASMNERDRLKFYASADDYAEIIRRRDIYQSSSRERMAQIEQWRQAELSRAQQESERKTAESTQAMEKATSKVFEDLKKSVSVLSDEEVAADVQRLAKGDYTDADPELKAYLAHSGALLPHILKALKEAKSQLETANKKIVGYRNGSPKAGGGSSETAKNVPDDVGFLEALDQQLG